MAFKLKPVPDVALEVPIDVPGDKGRSTRSSITVRYRLLSVSEHREVLDAAPENRIDDDELMARDIINIEGVADEDGKPLEYSTELLAQLMDVPYVRLPIVQGWMRAQTGAEEARQKN